MNHSKAYLNDYLLFKFAGSISMFFMMTPVHKGVIFKATCHERNKEMGTEVAFVQVYAQCLHFSIFIQLNCKFSNRI